MFTHGVSRRVAVFAGILVFSAAGGEASAAESYQRVRKRADSPDTIELTRKIRELIVDSQGGETAPDFKPQNVKVSLKSGDPPAEFAMVPVPGGEFLMGSPDTEDKRGADEGPRVKVRIDPFWMGATEVTWDLYMPFMISHDARWGDGSKKYRDPMDGPVDAVSRPTSPYADMTFGMGEKGYPAVCMTEHAASKFCQWLSAKTGRFYRLPTEAEWEYAARAGTATAWSFGDDPSKTGEYAWFFGNSEQTQPVGKKKPNPWGLYDIHGNVMEWTRDQHSADFYAALAARASGGAVDNPWNQPVSHYPRAVRGGSWDDDPENLRSACRRGSTAEWINQDPELPKSLWYLTSAQFLGMRVVRPLKLPSVEEMHAAWNTGVLLGE